MVWLWEELQAVKPAQFGVQRIWTATGRWNSSQCCWLFVFPNALKVRFWGMIKRFQALELQIKVKITTLLRTVTASKESGFILSTNDWIAILVCHYRFLCTGGYVYQVISDWEYGDNITYMVYGIKPYAFHHVGYDSRVGKYSHGLERAHWTENVHVDLTCFKTLRTTYLFRLAFNMWLVLCPSVTFCFVIL